MCPERVKYTEYLKSRLGDIPIAMDTDRNLWNTCKSAWLKHDRKKKWALTLQDDAIISDDFYKKAEEILKNVPDNLIVSFYAGNKLAQKIELAKQKGRGYVIDRKIYNEMALCLRTEWIDEMIKFCDDRNATTDKKIQLWTIRTQKQVYYSLPSIINHRLDKSVYREIFNKNMPDSKRQAYWYIG